MKRAGCVCPAARPWRSATSRWAVVASRKAARVVTAVQTAAIRVSGASIVRTAGNAVTGEAGAASVEETVVGAIAATAIGVIAEEIARLEATAGRAGIGNAKLRM